MAVNHVGLDSVPRFKISIRKTESMNLGNPENLESGDVSIYEE